jgi:hypothetical protein
MTIPQETDQCLPIQRALQRLNEAAERCEQTLLSDQDNGIEKCSARQTARDDLVLEALKFLQIAQGPIDAAATCFERVGHSSPERALDEGTTAD